MSDLTPLDKAHARMTDNEDSDQARLGFYERLAESELFLMLAKDVSAEDDAVRLRYLNWRAQNTCWCLTAKSVLPVLPNG